ncbi:MAG: hypothetical protein QOC59_29, partial [Microbacteriaceae bacterium]|nr:hypothetical protein [Microbacteriaceae bacterium]
MAFRPRDNKTPSGAKRRWTTDDRARRAPADPGARRPTGNARRPEAAPTSRAGRRDAAFGADRRRAEPEQNGRPDRRTDWYPGPRTNPRRDEQRAGERRPAADERRGRPSRDDRPARSFDRSSRDDRPARSFDRPSRDDRPGRGERSERPARSYDRPSRTERPERTYGGRPASADRTRDARPSREPFRGGRPGRTDRPFREDRPERRTTRPDAGPRRGAEERHEPWTPPEDVVLARLEGEVVTAEQVAGVGFADLGLGDGITRALGELGATTPFPIQAATIPDALAGRNVLGRGRTGSGKTIAFGAALVERLMRNWHESPRAGTGRRMGRAPRALILAPTRELALQIDRTVQPIARSVGLFTTQIVGGVPQGRQVGALGKGVDIVIGTPGRMEDLIDQGRLDLSQIEITVLDEAD